MAHDDFDSYGGSDSGSNGVSASTVPLPIQRALKPRKPMSAAAAQEAVRPSNVPADAAYDPIFENYDWESPYGEPGSEQDHSGYSTTSSVPAPFAPAIGPPALGQKVPGPLHTESEASKGTPADNGVAPSATDISSGAGSLPSSVQSDSTPALPTLDKQGPKNKILNMLSRITGMTAAQPKPGQPYQGPTTTEGKLGSLGNWLNRLSTNYQEQFGTPLDRELAMKRRQLGNEAAWRAAMIGVKSEANDINQQKADTAQSKMLGDMRRYGYALNDPNDPNSGFRSLTEPEILADPELGTKFRVQMSKMGLNDAQTDKVRDMLLGRFEVDPWVAAVAGDPTMSGQKVSAQQYAQIGKVLQAKGIQIKDLGTEGMWALDRIGNKIHQVSAVGPSVARAQMYAMMRPLGAIDAEGNERYAWAKDAVAQGMAPVGAGASAISKQAQMQDIKVASQQMRQAINHLESPLSPETIAELTMAARSTDPSVLSTEIDSLIGSQQLTSDQQNFLVWMAQLHERAMSLRNIAGMGAASDKLRDAIIATLPSAKSGNRELMTRQLDAFDNMVDNLEKGIPGVGRSTTPVHRAVQSHGENATIRIRASDGSIHELPTENLGKARQRDPGLQVLN